MDIFSQNIREWLSQLLSLPIQSWTINIILLATLCIGSIVTYYLTILILRGVAIVVEKTETDWDDDLINAKLLKALSLLSPAIVVDILLPYCFYKPAGVASVLHIITAFYIIWVTVYAASVFLDNLMMAFSRRERFRPYAVKGIFQMGKLILIGVGVIIGLSLIVGKSPVAILTALGASAAILMLVFKDTIMGLVASVQLTVNKMVHKGDWIIVPKHNANGKVIDITLTTIKVRNWDNSITTVPPYSLVSDSFENYQAMKRSGGRRVSRAVNIDINSVRFLDPAELETLRAGGYLPERKKQEYVIPSPKRQRAKGSQTPMESKAEIEVFDNPERERINIRLFRNYLEHWLGQHPAVRHDMMFMVRQLAPTPTGLPLELYFFTPIVEWVPFEHLQSDIFDHVYATAPLFGLTIFQSPSGLDITHALSANP